MADQSQKQQTGWEAIPSIKLEWLGLKHTHKPVHENYYLLAD